MTPERDIGIDLYWLPLGAGGHFVRFNGRVYEFFSARRHHRTPRSLYHSALIVHVPEGAYVIEDAWPIPDLHGASRGVAIEGPVWSRGLGRLRVFRYEVRNWRDGTISDIGEAVASPQRVGNQLDEARAVLALASSVPIHTWGRDALHVGDMWNSNSVISWLLTSAGIDARSIEPPSGGRAPGWIAGILAAETRADAAPVAPS